MSYEFTSESVSEGHPDKVADLISDAIATYLIDGKLENRAAIETLVTTNLVILAGEYKSSKKPAKKTIEKIVRDVIKSVGYEQEGFHWNTVKIENHIHGQSADIALGTDSFGAGDQGLMIGYACRETPEYMPLPIFLSHRIMERLTELRKTDKNYSWLGPDSKAQVTVEYEAVNMPIRVSKVVCSTQHDDAVDIDFVRTEVQKVIEPILGKLHDPATQYHINPTGRFVIGGPDGDTGLTGRKIIVDTYGGYAAHGGGAFSGKDSTKVDRSAAYMARYIAKNLVHLSEANTATVQLAYAIGIEEPMSVYVKVNGEIRNDLAAKIRRNVDLRPKAIIEKFALHELDLTLTTNYGHMGKPNLPWEKLDMVLV